MSEEFLSFGVDSVKESCIVVDDVLKHGPVLTKTLEILREGNKFAYLPEILGTDFFEWRLELQSLLSEHQFHLSGIFQRRLGDNKCRIHSGDI